MVDVLIFFLIILLASYFQSITSFGQGLIAAPIVILGGYLGNDEARRIKQRTYRILVMFAVLLAGLVAIFEGLRGTLG